MRLRRSASAPSAAAAARRTARKSVTRANARPPRKKVAEGELNGADMAGLDTYHSKRNFGVTAEPQGQGRAQARPRLRHPEARRDAAAL